MPSNALSPIEFQILSLVVEERTGREVAALFARETGRRIAFGSLYTGFRRLRNRGLVATRDDPERDRRIRYFRATPSGLDVLRRSRAYYSELARFGAATGNMECAR